MKVRAADRERPWMGLHSFPEDSADYFHGRRVEADEMYSLCVRETLALLYGKSGLGKTSLIQAAIAPRLRDNDYLPVVARLNYDGRAPSLIEQVVQHLRNSVQISKADLVFPPEFGTLWELFHHKQFEIWSRTSRSLQTPVLILDQFEEYIISGVIRRSERTCWRTCDNSSIIGRPNHWLARKISPANTSGSRFAAKSCSLFARISLRILNH
jgi:hypothetical protein